MWDKKYHVISSMGNRSDGYAMFLGRWQPLHDGHKEMFNQVLQQGGKICIMIRDMPTDEKNPFTAQEVQKNIEEYFRVNGDKDKVQVIIVPNITSINFGRGVGYDIVEHIPPAEVAGISATKIREEAGKQSVCSGETPYLFDGSKSCVGNSPSFIVPGDMPNDFLKKS